MSTSRVLLRSLALSLSLASVARAQSMAGGAPAATAAGGRATAQAAYITKPIELLQAMRDRYDRKWPASVTFVQKNTEYREDGTEAQSTWLEAMQLPGKLRIDVEPRSDKSGMLFVRDSLFVVRNDSVVRAAARPHPLMLLAGDVYFKQPQMSFRALEKMGFDMKKMHDETWEGRPVVVVGAFGGDLRSRQFWVDRERLVLVRLIEPSAGDSTKTSEVRLNGYQPLGDGWIAPEIVVYEDGKPVWREEYTEIRTDIALDKALFETKRWSEAPHWRGKA